MTIEQVLQQHQNALMKKEGVLGVGRGEQDGSPTITVFVRRGSSPSLPTELDGFPVKRIESDDIRAL